MNRDDRRVLPVGGLPLLPKAPSSSNDNRASSPAYTRSLFAGYRPHPKQVKFHRSTARIKAIVAGRRAGKTTAGGREFVRRVYQDFARWSAAGGTWRRPSKLGGEVKGALQYWCVAPTYSLTNLQKAEIFECLGGADSPLVLKYNRGKNRLWLKGGIRIDFRSANRPNFLVGDDIHGVWLDEAARIKAGAWSENIYPNLSATEGWAIITSTPLGRNWLYEEIWQRTQHGTDPALHDEEYDGHHYTTRDNIRVPQLVLEAQLAEMRLPQAIYLRNYEASFDAFAGQIYTDFVDREPHIVEAIPWRRIVRKWAGVDWGTGNPGALVELGMDDAGTVWVLREDYETGLPLSAPTHTPTSDCWINRMKKARARGVTHFWADPSGAGQILQCQQEGLDVRPARNDVIPGIDAVSSLLTVCQEKAGQKPRPALYIHRGCRNLRAELVSYRWDDSGERPVKERDHAADALRYGIFTEHLLGGGGGGGGIQRLDWSIYNLGGRQDDPMEPWERAA